MIYTTFSEFDLEHTLNLDTIPKIEDKVTFGKNQNRSDIFLMLTRITITFDIEAYHDYISKEYPVRLISRGHNIHHVQFIYIMFIQSISMLQFFLV